MNHLADLVRKHLEATPKYSIVSSTPLTPTRVSQNKRTFLDSVVTQATSRPTTKVIAGRTSLLTKTRLEVAAPVSSKVIVGTACLELAPISLSDQIYEFGRRLAATGVDELKLLPVFLMSGVHVTEDIPAEVATAKKLLGDSIKLTLYPHLGSHTKMPDVLAERLAAVPAEGLLLIAHGSRKPKGNKAIRTLAKQLKTTVAYWSTPPDIETQVINLMQRGCQRITILPYFLFAGGITDAITHRTEELAERFPNISFRLLPTLGATDEIADLAVELMH